MTSNHPETTVPARQPVFTKVGEVLYRLESSGAYYALLKRGGKQIRRSLKSTDAALARRRLTDLRAKVARLPEGEAVALSPSLHAPLLLQQHHRGRD